MNSRDPKTENTTTIEGQLDAITFCNAENHYTVARLRPEKTAGVVTVVGHLPGVSPGQTLKISGAWVTHPRFGSQFKVESYEITLPATVEGIRRYLESGFVKGIGPQMADRLVRQFGEQTLDIIETSPERLTEVEGIGPAKAERIIAAWQEHHAVRRIMTFLRDHGVNAAHSSLILRTYGDEALDVLETNPFQLAEDIPFTGFLIADIITRGQGVAENDPRRVTACIRHLIEKGADEGHAFVPLDELMERCRSLFAIDEDDAQAGLDSLESNREITIVNETDMTDSPAVYARAMHQAETGIAARIKTFRMLSIEKPAPQAEEISHRLMEKLAIMLSTEQMEALTQMMRCRVSVLTGGPGTGKTTLIRSLVAIFESRGLRTLLAAPTGRAARRLAEITGHDAHTIHRQLGYNFRDDRFERNRDYPLEADAVIVDEASMVDTMLMHHLLNAVPLQAMLCIVGDAFQLPSVGPGNVLSDMIESGQVPVFSLTRIFRQAEESPIVINAHRVRDGEMPEIERTDETLTAFHFIEEPDIRKIADRIVALNAHVLPEHFHLNPVTDIQVITPMHRGDAGTLSLNQALQKALNPVRSKSVRPAAFRTGDKVMHLKNNYLKDVFNGDIGFVKETDPDTGELLIDYDGREVPYSEDELHEVTLAYAITVHKSQGSEYPAAIIPLTTAHYIMLQRNLLYTAITRGKQAVILVGDRKALAVALRNDRVQQRLSGLKGMLRDDY